MQLYLSIILGKEVSELIEYRLDPISGVPTYLQIARQVEQALRLGLLRPTEQLPKVKDVVAALAINPNTVLKAYRELEHKGIAVGRPGQGTFIRETLNVVPLDGVRVLRRGLDRWLAQAAAAGLDDEAVRALVDTALHDAARHRNVAAS